MSEPPTHSSLSRVRRALRAGWPWLALAAALGLWTIGTHGGATLTEGATAPALAVPWTGEGEFDLGDQRGHVVVLAFWATWCPACRTEGPVLSRVQEQIEGHGDRVVGVSVDEAPLDAIGRAATQLGMTYPIAKATRTDLDRFSVELLPTIYVIGRDGRIVESFTGAVGEERILEAVVRARGSASDGERLSQR